MKLGEMIQRIQYLERKDELVQKIVQDLGTHRGGSEYSPELVAEVQSDIDRLLRAPILEELEELRSKEVKDGRRRTPKSEG